MNIVRISLILLIFVVACTDKQEKEKLGTGELIRIAPEEVDKKYMRASIFVDSVEYIPLETPHEAIIGRIKAIQEWEGRFYIWDEQSDAIFIFDEQGNFLKKAGAKGRGPKEYISISSFYQNPKSGDLYIRCDRSFSIIQYNAEGVFMKRIPCQFITTDFVVLGTDSLVLYGGKMPNQEIFRESFPEQWRLVMMKEGKVIKKDFPGVYDRTLLNDVAKSRNFSCSSDSILLMEAIGNNIYRLYPDGEFKPRYTVDFGKYTYPLTFDKPKDEALEIMKLAEKDGNKWCKLIDIWETENNLLISYSFQNYIFDALYSKKTGNVYNIGPVWVNDIDKLPMPSICSSGKDYFLGTLEAHIIHQAVMNADTPSPLLRQLAEGRTEMDNPILVKLKMKDF